MPLLVTLLAVAVSAYGFFRGALLVDLFPSFQPIIVTLSIMVAAILVRLNRGMPTLEWKSLLPTERMRLTSAIVDLAREYLVIVATNAALLITLVVLTAVGRDSVIKNAGLMTQVISGWIGGCLAICLARMAYVVWRDYDIVRLQKTLIDAAARRDQAELEAKIAQSKIAEIKAAGLTPVPDRRDAGEWPAD